jgi:hypothetical protein
VFLSTSIEFHPLVPSTASGNVDYILQLLVPLASTGEIRLDGQIIPALQYKRIPLSRYYYYYTNISNGLHTLAPVSQDAKFIATVLTRYHGDHIAAKYVIGIDLPVSGR